MTAPIEQRTVGETLASAGILPERCGRSRTRGLTDPERELYRWVLFQFAERGRPSGQALRAEALTFGLDPDSAISVLERDSTSSPRAQAPSATSADARTFTVG